MANSNKLIRHTKNPKESNMKVNEKNNAENQEHCEIEHSRIQYTHRDFATLKQNCKIIFHVQAFISIRISI